MMIVSGPIQPNKFRNTCSLDSSLYKFCLANRSKIWDKAVLYENEESSVIQKFLLSGRLQADYYSFENDVDNSSEDDSEWRRFRFGFKASLFGGITFHSEANMNLNQPEPLYRNLTDTYFEEEFGTNN